MIASIQAHHELPAEHEAEYVLSPDVILVTVDDGSARLLDMSGDFHALSDVGARMLQETLRTGADAAAARVAEAYGVDRALVASDLAVLLHDLESQGVLLRRNGRRRRKGVIAALAPALLRPVLHVAHSLVRSPAARARVHMTLARLSFALLGWTPTLAAWQQAHRHFPERQAGEHDLAAIQALDAAVRTTAAGHPIAVACKERALCAWSLARAAGLQATLIVGIELFPIAAHCWCEVGGQPLGDDREWCINFMPVARW